jgi:hypothetical protein
MLKNEVNALKINQQSKPSKGKALLASFNAKVRAALRSAGHQDQDGGLQANRMHSRSSLSLSSMASNVASKQGQEMIRRVRFSSHPFEDHGDVPRQKDAVAVVVRQHSMLPLSGTF